MEVMNRLDATTRQMSPEQRLIVAIFEQAILDVKQPKDPRDADEAWSFLTDESGGFAQSRRDYCEALGLDGAWLRETVQRTYREPAAIRAEEKDRNRRRSRTALPVN